MTHGFEIAPMARHAQFTYIYNLSVAKNAGQIPNGPSQCTFYQVSRASKDMACKRREDNNSSMDPLGMRASGKQVKIRHTNLEKV